MSSRFVPAVGGADKAGRSTNASFDVPPLNPGSAPPCSARCRLPGLMGRVGSKSERCALKNCTHLGQRIRTSTTNSGSPRLAPHCGHATLAIVAPQHGRITPKDQRFSCTCSDAQSNLAEVGATLHV